MSRPAIIVDQIGKRYRLGRPAGKDTFREALIGAVKGPFRRVRDPRLGPGGAEEFWALKGVSFEVQSGAVVGIVGRNGAGKSTLLKILSRITEPTEGCIRMRGRLASLLEVGTGFHPDLSGRENIYLNGSILGMKKAEISRKFDEIVAFAEIERFLDTQVKHYSSGMYVRLAFAVAAHLDPEILVIDEVLAVGDAAFQKKCLGKMQQVATAGDRIVLFVSHNLAVIRSLCDRVVWLKEGRVMLDAPAASAVEAFMADLLGDSDHQYDLETLDRSHVKDPLLRICKVALNGGSHVRHGEPLEIEIEYKSSANIEDVGFLIAFTSMGGGTRAMSIGTDVPGDRFKVHKGTHGRVVLRIPDVPLQPGRYILDVGARSGDNHAVDVLMGFTQAEILPGPNTPAVIVAQEMPGGAWMPANSDHTYSTPSGGSPK